MGVYETVVHYLTKEIIQEQGFLNVPDVDFELSEYAQSYYQVFFDKIEMEKSVGSFRPDLKCFIKDSIIYIEVAVTHFVDDDKKEKIFKDGNPVLEIDLSNESRILTKEQLKVFLTNGISKMEWINNPKIHKRFLKKEGIANGIKKFVLSSKRTLTVYGKNHNIYNCPIFKQYYDKVKIEDECYRCRCFVVETEGVSHLGEEPKYQSRSVDCIGHVLKEYMALLISNGIKVGE